MNQMQEQPPMKIAPAVDMRAEPHLAVCFEGLDASGKSTQAALLAGYAGARLFKFPMYEQPMGRLIKEHLHRGWLCIPVRPSGDPNKEAERLDAMVFQALQLANRMEAAVEVSRAMAGGPVVFDRYWPSGYAYGRADGIEGEYLVGLHAWLPQPRVFILLEIPPELAYERAGSRGERDRYEDDAALLGRVAHNYLALWDRGRAAGLLGARWVRVSGAGSPAEVFTRVLGVLGISEQLALRVGQP